MLPVGQIHGLQGFLHRLHRFDRFTLEAGSELVNGSSAGAQSFADRLDLIAHGFRPGRFGDGFRGSIGFQIGEWFLLGRALFGRRGRMLPGGTQPADLALRFFPGALGVEIDQPAQQFFLGFLPGGGFVGKGRGRAGLPNQRLGQITPAVGGEDGAIQIVVQSAYSSSTRSSASGSSAGRSSRVGSIAISRRAPAGGHQWPVELESACSTPAVA